MLKTGDQAAATANGLLKNMYADPDIGFWIEKGFVARAIRHLVHMKALNNLHQALRTHRAFGKRVETRFNAWLLYTSP